jgi:hypothetical protein
MQQRPNTSGWVRGFLGLLLLLCVFCATTAVAAHLHPRHAVIEDPHCDLCTMSAGLVAAVVAMVLVVDLIWFRRLQAQLAAADRLSSAHLGAHWPVPCGSLTDCNFVGSKR